MKVEAAKNETVIISRRTFFMGGLVRLNSFVRNARNSKLIHHRRSIKMSV